MKSGTRNPHRQKGNDMSSLKDRYFEINGTTPAEEEVIARREMRVKNTWIFIGNLIFNCWWAVVAICIVVFLLGVLEVIVWQQFWLGTGTLATAIALAVATLGLFFCAQNRSESPRRVQQKWQDLIQSWTKITKLTEEITLSTSIEGLSEIARERLLEISRELTQIEMSDKDKASILRAEFRHRHNVFFQLGLVQGEWGIYFKD